MKQYGAEFFGTFWLVLGGCGSAVLAAGFPGFGIGFAGVALANMTIMRYDHTHWLTHVVRDRLPKQDFPASCSRRMG